MQRLSRAVLKGSDCSVEEVNEKWTQKVHDENNSSEPDMKPSGDGSAACWQNFLSWRDNFFVGSYVEGILSHSISELWTPTTAR